MNLSAPGASASPGAGAVEAGGAIEVFQRENPDQTRSAQSIGFPLTGALSDPATIPATGTAGVPVSMSIGALDELAPLAGAVWSFGDGTTAAGPTVTHTYAAAGDYTVSVSGADALENVLPGSAVIAIAPATVPAPVLGPVAQSATSWREGTHRASLASRRTPPIGTTFSFTLSEAATLEFTFSTRAGGRRVKGRCVAPGRHNARARRCSRSIVRGSLSLGGRAGRDKVRFQGLLSKHSRLAPGSYTLTLIASAAGRKSAARSLRFTIVR
jgi:hypothetical protein